MQIGGNPSVDNTLPNSNYSFSWSPSMYINNPQFSNPNVYPLTTTQYTLNVNRTDSLGNVCTMYDSVNVTVNPLPNVTLSNLGTVCEGSNPFLLSSGSPSGGVYTCLLYTSDAADE